MATTSIWSIKGQLGNVVEYVKNPAKTESLGEVLGYTVNGTKTEQKHYVSGINCSPGKALEQMYAAKKHFSKEGGIVAYHGYQSFAPGEVTPDTAHEIGLQLAQRLWGEKYQVVVATHLDRGHIHNHFVVNTVSWVDGQRYHRTAKDYHDMQAISDELCRQYSLSVIQRPESGRAKQYGEWNAEQQGHPTWRGMVKADVDAAIVAAQTDRQFFDLLRKKGYAVKVGKDISVRPPGKERFVRLMRNFGEGYSLEAIKKRILDNRMKIPAPPKKSPPLVVLHCRMRGPLSRARKITGWRALYFQYLYKMGILPHKKTPYQKHRKVHFLLREDIIKLKQFDEETRLLWREKIDTPEQLLSFKETASKKEAKICERILARAPVMREKLNTVRQEEKTRGKEHLTNEHVRRRSGTNRAVVD
jgi:hypothetical protein